MVKMCPIEEKMNGYLVPASKLSPPSSLNKTVGPGAASLFNHPFILTITGFGPVRWPSLETRLYTIHSGD